MDIRDPNWRPGKRMLARAAIRAERYGIPFDKALAEQIEDAKAALLISHVANERKKDDAAELYSERRNDRRSIFPEPQSVRAIPTATESDRRKH